MTSPVSIPAGHELVAADFDAYENLTGVWQAYTPVWTASGSAPALGNGSLTGFYFQAGKLVQVRILLIMGSTTTFGTSFYRLSLPVAPIQNGIIPAFGYDQSATQGFPGVAWIIAQTAGGDNMRIVIDRATGGATNLVPFTWASTDRLIIQGTYEAV